MTSLKGLQAIEVNTTGTQAADSPTQLVHAGQAHLDLAVLLVL